MDDLLIINNNSRHSISNIKNSKTKRFLQVDKDKMIRDASYAESTRTHHQLYKTLQVYKIELYKIETSQIDNNSVMTAGPHLNSQQ